MSDVEDDDQEFIERIFTLEAKLKIAVDALHKIEDESIGWPCANARTALDKITDPEAGGEEMTDVRLIGALILIVLALLGYLLSAAIGFNFAWVAWPMGVLSCLWILLCVLWSKANV